MGYIDLPVSGGGITIYPNLASFPPSAQDGAQGVAADTNSIYIYNASLPGWVAVATPPVGVFISDLTGDVTATGPGSAAATVAFVGGETAADVAQSVQDTQAATDLSTVSTIVKRDASGQTSLDGLNLDGSTSGAISIQAANTTTSYTVKMPSAQGASSSVLQNDGSGNLSWSVLPTPVTSVTGSAPISSSGGTTPAISISQSSTTVDGYLSATNFTTFNNAATDVSNATALSTVSTLVKRDSNGETALDGLTLDGSTSGSIKIQSAASVAVPYTIKMPNAQGAASTFLQNDGSGNLSWAAGGSSGANTSLSNLSSVAINTALLGTLGAVGSPAYSFTGDIDTGMWSSGANTLNFSTGGSERLTINSSGNIGVGTTNPSVELEVDSGSAVDILKLVSNAYSYTLSRDNGNGNLKFTGSQTNNVGYTFSSPSGDRLTIAGNGDVTVAQNLTVSTNATISGVAGIGVGPVSGVGLVVSGGTNGDQLRIQQSATHYKIGRESSQGYLQFEGSQPGFIGYQFLENGIDVFRIDINKSVIVNETGADADFRVEGDTDQYLLVTDASADKVGIGTSTPAQKLDVNGTAQATAFKVPNYILSPQLYDEGTETGNFTLNLANGPAQQVTINAAGPLTITLSNPVTGGAYLIKIIQGATPGTVTWPANVLWGAAGAPTLSLATGDIDIINLFYDGTDYYGTYALGF